MGKIKNTGTATMRFKEGLYVTGSAANENGTDSEYSLVVSGSALIEGTLASNYRWVKIDKFSKSGNYNAFYIKAEGAGNQSQPGSTTYFIPPASGRLISAHLRSRVAMNSTQITLVTTDAGDNPENSNDTGGDHNFVETQIVNCNAGKTNFAFNFTSDAKYTAGQALLLKVSGSAAGGDGMLTTVWEYNFFS